MMRQWERSHSTAKVVLGRPRLKFKARESQRMRSQSRWIGFSSLSLWSRLHLPRRSIPGIVDRAVVISDVNDGGVRVRALKASFKMKGFTSIGEAARIGLTVSVRWRNGPGTHQWTGLGSESPLFLFSSPQQFRRDLTPILLR
ncbi:hypothetical protein U1Q18_034056 [Sarracenia purpurea var. burkii]